MRANEHSSESGTSESHLLIYARTGTLDDFLQARMVVRPTRGRFANLYHDVGAVAPSTEFDEELYN